MQEEDRQEAGNSLSKHVRPTDHGQRTLDEDGLGAGEGVLEGTGDVPDATLVPSGPFTDTLGMSGLGASPGVAPLETDLRAPGGTYAFVPRTTAPYLKAVQRAVESIDVVDAHLSSSLMPLSSTICPRSSAR